MHTERRNANGKIVKAKGIKLMNEVNQLLQEDENMEFKFQTGGYQN